MIILAIDTSSSACSVALLINDEVKVLHEVAPMQQAQKILPMIDALLRESYVSLDQLNALAFGCGPGSFTGVRIATSVMQGIGFAMNLPLIPVSSLAALAQAAYYDLGWKKLLVAVDARIQEVYWGMYQVNDQGIVELMNRELVCSPEEIPLPNTNDWYAVGNAWDIYRNQINYQPLALDITRQPTASAILPIAQIKYLNKDWVSPENAVPTYLRNNVAKVKKA